MLATPTSLFGRHVGEAITSLVATLRNAAAISVGNPRRIAELIDDLSEIEGAAGNLRGILFELISAYLARQDAVSIDLGVTARHPETGKPADIDILKVRSRAECVCIECKGKNPGGTVSRLEVQDWLRRIPTFRAHLTAREQFREALITFEIWTSGRFEPDAVALLECEQAKRKKSPIQWKDGAQVAGLARNAKEKSISNALNEHFLKHPLHVSA